MSDDETGSYKQLKAEYESFRREHMYCLDSRFRYEEQIRKLEARIAAITMAMGREVLAKYDTEAK